MGDAEPKAFASLDAEEAFLSERLQAGTLDRQGLQVAAICGHPAAVALWAQLGEGRGGRRPAPKASDLTRRLFKLAPSWGLAAARETLRAVLRWMAPSHSHHGREMAAALLQALDAPGADDALWHQYLQRGYGPIWGLEKAALALWQATANPSLEEVQECVVQCCKGLQEAGYPLQGDQECDRETGWAVAESLTAIALGYEPKPWRRPLGKAKRWRVWQEEGSGHGDLYELEQTTYLYLLDWQTKTHVHTFTGEMSASMGDGGWTDYAHGGVRKVSATPTGKLEVQYWSGQVELVDPAGLSDEVPSAGS